MQRCIFIGVCTPVYSTKLMENHPGAVVFWFYRHTVQGVPIPEAVKCAEPAPCARPTKESPFVTQIDCRCWKDHNALAILVKYIILPQASGVLWNSMSRSNSPVAEEILKGHVGTVPKNTTLQIAQSPRRLSQRRGSPRKQRKLIIQFRDTKVVLPQNEGFGVHPPTPCRPHSHDDARQDCNRNFITRACVLVNCPGKRIQLNVLSGAYTFLGWQQYTLGSIYYPSFFKMSDGESKHNHLVMLVLDL